MQRPVLTTLFGFCVLVWGIVFLWWPQYQNFSRLRLEIREKKFALQTKKEYFSNLENIAKTLKEHSQEVAKIESALPAKVTVSDLVNFVNEISSQNGLLLQKFEVGNPSSLGPDSNILKIPLTISVAGSYSSFKNFLAELQKSSRLLEIENISFLSSGQSAIMSFDLKLRTHSYFGFLPSGR
jgi:Tfp pilus assembly protein PilO